MNFVIITNVYQTNSICFAVYVYRNVILILPFESYFYLKYRICFPRIKLTLQMFFCLFLTYFIFKSTHSALFPNFFFFKVKHYVVSHLISVDVNTTSISAQDKDISCSAKNSKARIVTRFDKLREMKNHCPNTIFSCDKT